MHSSTYAQILNLNKRMLQSDSAEWVGQISVFFSLIDQEVNIANMGYNIDVIKKFKNHSLMAISKLSFASSNKETLLNDGYAHVRATFNRKKRVGEEFFGQVQYNAIRGLQDRSLVGIGLRYVLFDRNNYGFVVGAALMQEWENWKYVDVISTTSLLKSSNYISLFANVNKQFNFNVISYYQATFINFVNPRISLEVNLNLNITEKLKFTSNFTLYYDKQPIIPIDNFIYTFKNGLGYQF